MHDMQPAYYDTHNVIELANWYIGLSFMHHKIYHKSLSKLNSGFMSDYSTCTSAFQLVKMRLSHYSVNNMQSILIELTIESTDLR